jgi:hypothetical protein
LDEYDVLDLVGSLFDKSLVAAEQREENTRYPLLESTREYGLAKLDEARELEALRARHADTMVSLADLCWEATFVDPVRTWRGLYAPETSNIIAAVEWLLEHAEIERAGRVLSGFAYVDPAAVNSQLRAPFNAVRAAAASDPRFLMTMAFAVGGLASAVDLLNRAEAGFAAAGDVRGRRRALIELVRRWSSVGDVARARDVLATIDRTFATGGDRYAQIRLAFARGLFAGVAGDVGAAIDAYAVAERLAREDGDALTLEAILCAISEAHFNAGDVDEARRAVRTYIKSGYGRFESRLMVLTNGAAYAIAAADWAEASDYLRRAFAEFGRVSAWQLTEICAVQNAAAVFTSRGDLSTAARLHGWADAAFAANDTARGPAERSAQNVILTGIAALPQAERETLEQAGASLSRDAVFALAAAL